jgi:hypothetical protein
MTTTQHNRVQYHETVLLKRGGNLATDLQNGYTVESLHSHFILTMSHWSTGLPVCFLSQGTQVQIQWGDLLYVKPRFSC